MCPDVTAYTDERYVIGPSGDIGCGLVEAEGASDCTDTAIGISGKVTGGVSGGPIIGLCDATESSC